MDLPHLTPHLTRQVESPTNPLLTLVDIPKLVEAVRSAQAGRPQPFRENPGDWEFLW